MKLVGYVCITKHGRFKYDRQTMEKACRQYGKSSLYTADCEWMIKVWNNQGKRGGYTYKPVYR